MTKAFRLMAVAGLFAAAFAASTAVGTHPAEAYACKTDLRYMAGTAVRRAQTDAVEMAKKNWQVRVKQKFGLAWSVWEISEGQHVQCVSNRGGGMLCVARSRPCKYVTG